MGRGEIDGNGAAERRAHQDERPAVELLLPEGVEMLPHECPRLYAALVQPPCDLGALRPAAAVPIERHTVNAPRAEWLQHKAPLEAGEVGAVQEERNRP